jgi:hypothetical protein
VGEILSSQLPDLSNEGRIHPDLHVKIIQSPKIFPAFSENMPNIIIAEKTI